MQLSKFFTLEEMTHSDTAVRHGIPNDPDEATTNNLKVLCDAVLDPLRAAVGAPIKVSSGYRGPALNAKIGGATTSQHMEGRAADLQPRSITVLELFKTVIRNRLPFDQVIYEAKDRATKWVHVSHDPARARGAILVADFNADGRVARYRTITAQEALALTESTTRSKEPEVLEYEELPDEPDHGGEPVVDDQLVTATSAPVSVPRPKAKVKVKRTAPTPSRKKAPAVSTKKKAARKPAKKRAAKGKALKRKATTRKAGKKSVMRRGRSKTIAKKRTGERARKAK